MRILRGIRKRNLISFLIRVSKSDLLYTNRQQSVCVNLNIIFKFVTGDPHAFWGGYFTSRPAFKGFERWASGHLQSTKQLQVLADLNGEEHDQLKDRLQEALGVSQHHDAITGTEKQNVYSDYVLTLTRGVEAADELISVALNKLYNTTNYSPQLTENQVEFCRKLNVSECKLTEEENKFVIHLYNPMAHSFQHPVRLPIKDLNNENSLLLLNSKGQQVAFDVVDIAEHVKVKVKKLVFQIFLKNLIVFLLILELT